MASFVYFCLVELDQETARFNGRVLMSANPNAEYNFDRVSHLDSENLIDPGSVLRFDTYKEADLMRLAMYHNKPEHWMRVAILDIPEDLDEYDPYIDTKYMGWGEEKNEQVKVNRESDLKTSSPAIAGFC